MNVWWSVTPCRTAETSRWSGQFLRNVGNIVHRRGHQFPAVRIRISSGKTKTKTGGRRPEEHSRYPTTTRVKERSRRRKRMEAHFERCQCPEGAISATRDLLDGQGEAAVVSCMQVVRTVKRPRRSLLFPHPAAHLTGSDDISPCLDADNTCFELVQHSSFSHKPQLLLALEQKLWRTDCNQTQVWSSGM